MLFTEFDNKDNHFKIKCSNILYKNQNIYSRSKILVAPARFIPTLRNTTPRNNTSAAASPQSKLHHGTSNRKKEHTTLHKTSKAIEEAQHPWSFNHWQPFISFRKMDFHRWADWFGGAIKLWPSGTKFIHKKISLNSHHQKYLCKFIFKNKE